ncbi:DUF4252 domain-containing protein [Aquimarina sp. MMG016]|uniref:DUF4252 domain-containing protein n=1 Tax=Aquimarina sp. MMG016 TaxID=2822690 RepID=UPI001B3A3CA4|nr:DUF4252 domain-containing protein [Aquimarina sp. MMG016]MBQ4821741.1 DUF4252 domain-containing protein [Aquimarina sp. MMG016]
MKNIVKAISVACIALLMSCNSEPSLQKYFVDHQEDNDFLAVDLPSSLIDTDKVKLTDDEKEALNSIKKVNVLALPLKGDVEKRFEEEKSTIDKILSDDKYETLMRFGSNGVKAVLKFQGEEDDIDEVIVFASHQEKGLALVRVLGDNMRPENMVKLMNAIDKGDVDLGSLENIAKTFDID